MLSRRSFLNSTLGAGAGLALAERNNLRVSHTHELPSNNAILSFEQSWW